MRTHLSATAGRPRQFIGWLSLLGLLLALTGSLDFGAFTAETSRTSTLPIHGRVASELPPPLAPTVFTTSRPPGTVSRIVPVTESVRPSALADPAAPRDRIELTEPAAAALPIFAIEPARRAAPSSQPLVQPPPTPAGSLPRFATLNTPPTLALAATAATRSANETASTIIRTVSPPNRPASASIAPHAAPLLATTFTPTYLATLGDGTPTTTSVPNLLGATTFYNATYTGSRAVAANIELGHPWNGHETLNWIPNANFFGGGGAILPPSSVQAHPTAVSHVFVGKGATDTQRGVAFGIANGNFYPGNITVNTSGGTTYNSLWQTYQLALIDGINGVPSQVVDVINSSFGTSADRTGAGAGNQSRVVDALLYLANQSHGATVVAAVGNLGPTPNTIFWPASGYNTIAVGALGTTLTNNGGPAIFNDVALSSSRGLQDFFLPNNPTPTAADAANGTLIPGVRARIDFVAPGETLYLAFNATNPTGYQRTRATSFSVPAVAGGVALLVDAARATIAGTPNQNTAIDGRVIKAVLLNSADKTAGWSNAQSWNGTTWSTTQSLDAAAGAGRLNLDQAFRQYVNSSNNVEQLFTAGLTQNVKTTGWAKGTLDRPVATTAAMHDFFLDTSLSRYTELNTTLSWFVNRFINTGTGATEEVGFHNLNLEVWRVASPGGALVQKVGEATAQYITSEHLTFLIPADGFYMIRVTRPAMSGATDPGTIFSFAPRDTTSDPYGLAWLTRSSILVTTGTTSNPTSSTVTPNAVVAPETGQTATLTYTGSTTNVSFPNAIYVGGGDSGAGGAGTLRVQSGATVHANNRVRVYNGGTINLDAATLSGGLLELPTGTSLAGTGAATLQFTTVNLGGSLTAGSGSTLTMTPMFDNTTATLLSRIVVSASPQLGGDGTLLLSGPISGTGSVTKVGAGTLALSQANTYTGGTFVTAGVLRVDNSAALPSGQPVSVTGGTLQISAGVTATAPITVSTAGILAGNGTVAGPVTINNGGRLSPGTSPGTLTVNGNVAFQSSAAFFRVELNGAAAGTTYDQLVIGSAGALNLGNATLEATLGFAPNPPDNDKLFIINNLFSGSITGTFNGIAQDDRIQIGTFFARVSYTGNLSTLALTGGNDVVLYEFVPIPEPGCVLLISGVSLGIVVVLRRRFGLALGCSGVRNSLPGESPK